MKDKLVELLNKQIEYADKNKELNKKLNKVIADFEKKGVLKKVQYPDMRLSMCSTINTIK